MGSFIFMGETTVSLETRKKFLFSAPALPVSVSMTNKNIIFKNMTAHTLTSPQVCHVRGRDRQNAEFLKKAHLWRENMWPLCPFLWSSISNKIWLLNNRGSTSGKIISWIFLQRIASKIVALSWHFVTEKKKI